MGSIDYFRISARIKKEIILWNMIQQDFHFVAYVIE